MVERELTAAVSLTLPDGSLNPEAVGWARRPLVDTSGIGGRHGWPRNKRWEYWNVVTPTHVLAFTVSLIDYAAVHEVWVFDRRSHQSWGRAATVLPPRGAVLPPVLDAGPARARAKGLAPADHDCLAVVVPWSGERFQYTVKDVALPASGTLVVGEGRYDIPAGESWAVLDHGRGRWPYDVVWNWGAGSGVHDGHVIGVQVGGRWTDGTGSTENGLLLDGHLHKISAELAWDYDLADWRRPWRVGGGGLEAVFTPEYNRHALTDLAVISSRTDQCFGWWSGSFGDITFEGIYGWAEDVHNRW
ncbi:MAG: DUF2804 domain-containing protein [Actinobacteria bacterium HGW-Actinobacteria-5]|nr:MAG: DUF2804 domain-containing protein [Actinobacteria bacterium HGW-Actinobacteria-5]